MSEHAHNYIRKVPRGLSVAIAVAAGFAASAHATPVANTEQGPGAGSAIALPPVGAVADYQLGGRYPPLKDVTVVTRDSTENPAPGLYNICYVNGFQSQPQDSDWWLSDHPNPVLRDDQGDPITDPNWPDELLLDTSTAPQRDQLANIIGDSILECHRRGYNAIEVDNLDSFGRSQGKLTPDDNIAFAAELADVAHNTGLAIGQKNSAQLSQRGQREAGFDFAVAEECYAYDECGAYSDVYGGHVIDIEYPDNLPRPFDKICADPGRPQSTILRDRELVTPEDPDYVYEHC